MTVNATMAEEEKSPQNQDQTSTEAASEQAAPVPAISADPAGFFWGTGRRKSSVARVRIRPGSGQYQVNGRKIDEHFREDRDRKNVVDPLAVTSTEGNLDIFVSVKGGGYTGQAGAVVLGLSRALKNYDSTLESTLRAHGLLTRDPREVERKKPGQPGARKRFQFSKR